ncbi:MAG TPA: hypothetical protein DCE41_30475 [Cytophagales bacterium]|nr:hypothetical protein [Cytophagales bacterium]HAA19130.1 hypothetical protein [Cytophagales bacterium]HAP62711.1 hypothetical protein [Cytophagales bacterium]
MRILITGGTGLIGSFFVKRLVDDGHEVWIYHRRPSLPSELQAYSPNIRGIQGDLFDLPLVSETVQACNAIIHSAGHVSFARREKSRLHRINVEATRFWVDVALNANIERFVYLSSVSALGLPKDQSLIDEKVQWEDQLSMTEYGRTKHLGEREVWRGIEEGLPGSIINPSVVLAPGAEIRSSLRMLDYVKSGGKFLFPGTVNYVDVRDLTQLMKILLLQEGEVGEQYIASAGSLSYAHFLSEIAAYSGVKPPSIRLPIGLLRTLAPIEEARNYLFGGTPLVTHDMVKSIRKSVTFDGSKAGTLKGFSYHSLGDSLTWVINEMWGTNRG